jgi:hypothetical protein
MLLKNKKILLLLNFIGLIAVFWTAANTAPSLVKDGTIAEISLAAPRCVYHDPNTDDRSEQPCSEVRPGATLADGCYLVEGFLPGTTATAFPCADFDEVLGGASAAAAARAHDCDGQDIAVNVNCANKSNVIYSYLAGIIKFLSAGVGLVIVLMIIISGIQYITARDNPQSTEAAKNRLWNALIALFLFIFMFAILNFLVPGGIL